MIHYNFNPFKLTIVRFVVVFSALIVLANSVILFYRATSTHKEEIKKAYIDAERLTKTVGDHIELTFLAVDVVLKRAVEKHQSNLLFGKNLTQDTQNNIISWVNETPQISAMLITDENGTITGIYRKLGYKPWMEGKISVVGEKYYAEHIDNYDSLYVGPQRSFIKNSPDFIVLSRRLNKLDGSFDGIVLAVVNNSYIKNFFGSIEKHKKTKLIVNHIDSSNLINPFSKSSAEYKEYLVKKDEVINLHKNGNDRNDITILKNDPEYSDDLRLYSFLQMPSVMMNISIIFYGEDILGGWKSDRFSDAIFYIIFLLFVLVIGFFSLELAKKVQKLRVSERRALAASKAKSDFLANMSHELRTPLNAIIGFSEMLTSEYFGKVNDKQKERLNDIHGCGNHLLSLINEVLDFSKGQAGKLEIKPEEVEFFRIVKEVVRIFEEKSEKENIKVINDVSKNLPYLFIDKRKIKQILINLISNAIKFCNEGGEVRIFSRINDKGNFEFIVKDNGIGMRKEDIPKALTAFGQVHQDLASGGTGLGLPLCKIFAELHDGTLKIDSEVGKGTTVTVELPQTNIID